MTVITLYFLRDQMVLSQQTQVRCVPSYWSAQMSNKGVGGVERWKTTEFLKQQLRSKNPPTVLIPTNISNTHWVLCVLFPAMKKWAIVDSAGGELAVLHSSFYINMRLWIDNKVSPEDPWEYIFPITTQNKHQYFEEDMSNCGVYVCHYGESIAMTASLEQIVKERLNKQQIQDRRDDILMALVEGIPLPELQIL